MFMRDAFFPLPQFYLEVLGKGKRRSLRLNSILGYLVGGSADEAQFAFELGDFGVVANLLKGGYQLISGY